MSSYRLLARSALRRLACRRACHGCRPGRRPDATASPPCSPARSITPPAPRSPRSRRKRPASTCWCSRPPAKPSIIPLVARGEAEFGIANVAGGRRSPPKATGCRTAADRRAPSAAARRSSCARTRRCCTIADLKGKKRRCRASRRSAASTSSRARDARHRRPDRKRRHSRCWCPTWSAAPTTSWPAHADMFFFAFGAPKVREVDATVGGIRALEIPESGMPAARKILPRAIWLRPRLVRSTSASRSRWASTPGTICCSPTPR